jgi:hypothetical protein
MKPTSGSDRLSFFSAIGTFCSWITRASQFAMTGTSASTSARRRCIARSAIALLLGSTSSAVNAASACVTASFSNRYARRARHRRLL